MGGPFPYPCPCCGYLVFEEPPGSYAMCPVCDWEDDAVQLYHLRSGGANEPLPVAQEAFLGWSDRRAREVEAAGRARCPEWRPLNPAASPKSPRAGMDYFTAIDRGPVVYYWRRGHANDDPEKH